jgi:AmmeMemoRadiSam system protein A
MSLAEPTAEERRHLLELACSSIRHGLDRGCPIRPDLDDYPASLTRPGASFVTLTRNGELRGCIGALEARQPLLDDVAEHAYAAAFRDPRFEPVRHAELDRLALSVSVLGEPEELRFENERELLACLRPTVDGVILQEGDRRGTFLPSVWDSLPEPREFLTHLKLKAGLSPDYWSTGLRAWRYTTTQFSTSMADQAASGLSL